MKTQLEIAVLIATANERKRIVDIVELCGQASVPFKATEYINSDISVAELRSMLGLLIAAAG